MYNFTPLIKLLRPLGCHKFVIMNNKEKKYHIPALLEESLDGLNIYPYGVYVDTTFGGGGHSQGILDRLGTDGRLYGFDQDADAEKNKLNDERFTFVRCNFRFLSNFMRYHSVGEINGIIADLGVSSHHFDDETRGFSFRLDGKLDMRMNNRAGKTAADVLNTYSEEQLADIFYYYGELKAARRIASAIVKRREVHPLIFSNDLAAIVSAFSNRENEKKFMAQAFQAVRIEVNQELLYLKELLTQSLALLTKGGRLAVITYHSLEDRIVKNFIKTGNFEGQIEQDVFGNLPSPFCMIGKAIVPSSEEIETNPRARSAKLRVAEKIAEKNLRVDPNGL